MIAYIEGRVAEVTEQTCVIITASGVGYEVFLTPADLAMCKNDGGVNAYYICSVIREDAFDLFGFSTWDERETFVILRSINRVGPKTALAILSTFSPDDLARIAIGDDGMALTSVPGIGKKTAQQIFIELKYKMEGRAVTVAAAEVSAATGVQHDAVTGLLNLGYAEQEAMGAVKQALAEQPDLGVGEALREALKILARGK